MALVRLGDGEYDPSYDERDTGGFVGNAQPQQPTAGSGGVSTTPGQPIDVFPTNVPAPTSPWNEDVFKTGGTASPSDTIASYYRSALGRNPENTDVVSNWLSGMGGNLAGIREAIYGSPEAKAYGASRTAQGNTQAAATNSDWIGQTLSEVQSTDDPNYWRQVIAADPKVAAGDQSAIDYWKDRIRRGDGSALVRNGQLQKFQDSGATYGQQSPYGGTSVFDDPATKSYEALINSLTQRLQQPYQAPDLNPSLDYLRSYFQKLQGPAYTPEQTDLQQTQALDPLERQRSAAKQQVMQRLGSRGISASSGIMEKAIEDVDRQFDQLRTQTQSGFANKAIGQQNQNFAQAAQLGPLIAALEQQTFQGNENRALQGLNLAGIVPNLAWSRLTGASNTINPVNPAGLFGLQNQFQQQGYNQGSNFGNSIFQLLSQIFG